MWSEPEKCLADGERQFGQSQHSAVGGRNQNIGDLNAATRRALSSLIALSRARRFFSNARAGKGSKVLLGMGIWYDIHLRSFGLICVDLRLKLLRFAARRLSRYDG